MADTDYTATNHGSLYLVEPHNDTAYAWLMDHVSTETQWMGRAVAVEPRYVQGLVEQLREDGFTVD